MDHKRLESPTAGSAPIWKRHGFVLGVFAVLGLALLFPGPGAPGGFFRPEVTTTGAVMFLFFLQGLTLPTGELLQGVRNIRFYLLSHSVLFLASPLCGLVLWIVLGGPWWWDRHVSLGFFYLAFLPTTVSTSVVLAGAVKPGAAIPALYNATLSNVLAVFLLPVIFLWGWSGEVGRSGEASRLWGEIFLLVLWPLIVGQGLRFLAGDWAGRNRHIIRRASHGGVLFIFYCALAGTLSGEEGWLLAWSWMLLVFAGCVGLYSALYVLACYRPWPSLSEDERISIRFTWPQKSVALGVPLAQILFMDAASLGLILLPLLMYHPFQLIMGALGGRAVWKRKDC